MKRFMKVLLSAALTAALILTALPATAADKPISVTLDGKTVFFPDAKPYIENGRVMVPIRFVSQSMGAQVEWVPKEYSVFIKKNGMDIQIEVDSTRATVNGVYQRLDVMSTIHENRVYVPLRFVSQGLGAFVKWEDWSRTVVITTSSPYGKGEEVVIEDGGSGTATVTMYDITLPFREVRGIEKVDDKYINVILNQPENFSLYLEPRMSAASVLIKNEKIVKDGDRYIAHYRIDMIPGKSIEDYPTLALRFGADRHLFFRFPNPLYKGN